MELPKTTPEFESILNYLKQHHECDLLGYKRSTLLRRFKHRMRSLGIQSYAQYLTYLQSHAEEYLELLDDVFINVTSFFRDREAWDYLAAAVLPRIVANKSHSDPIRIWSAGCAAGQEIYSVLILLAEAYGIEFCQQNVLCYATDADQAAVQQARFGIYTESEVFGLSIDQLQKYFNHSEQGYVIHPALRQTIIFGRHDLAKDAPISRIDLLLCRNVLIYFTTEAQTSMLIRFHFSLKPTGYLLLGQSETMMIRRQIFSSVNLKHRIYKKGLKLDVQDHLAINPGREKRLLKPLMTQSYFWRTAFEKSLVPQCAIDLDGDLVEANEQANLLFGLTIGHRNLPFHELEPGKLIDSKALMPRFENDSDTLRNVRWNLPEKTRYFDITIAPVFRNDQKQVGFLLSFIEVHPD